MGVLVPDEKIDHTQHLTMELGNIGLRLIIIDRNIVPQKKLLISEKLEESGQEVMYPYNYFNCNYMELVGYGTCDKLIWTSSGGCRNKNKISKNGI